MRNTIPYYLVLLINCFACDRQADIWKEEVLSDTKVLEEPMMVVGGRRLTSESLVAYLPLTIGETLRSSALLEVDENFGSGKSQSMVAQPYYKGLNSVVIEVTDNVDVKKFKAIENKDLEIMIVKEYSNNQGLRFIEKYLYDSNYIRKSQLNISNERFSIKIIANGRITSPAPLPSYLNFVYSNSYLPKLFELPAAEIRSEKLVAINNLYKNIPLKTQ